MKHVQTARVSLVTQAGEGAGEAQIAYGFEGAGRCALRLWNGEIDVTEDATDFFEALCKVRLKLETRGLLVATYGGSRTVFPSGMGRDMGAGLRAYRHSLGERGGLECLVHIFDTGPDVEPATVDQQRAFVDQWLSSTHLEVAAVQRESPTVYRTLTPEASRALSISWAPVAVVLMHLVMAGLIGHRRDLDPVFHFLGGVAGAYAACQALVLVPRLASRVGAGHAKFLAVAAVAIVAVLWEGAEFASDRLLGSHIQLSRLDTTIDLALGIGGAVIGAIVGAASRGEAEGDRG